MRQPFAAAQPAFGNSFGALRAGQIMSDSDASPDASPDDSANDANARPIPGLEGSGMRKYKLDIGSADDKQEPESDERPLRKVTSPTRVRTPAGSPTILNKPGGSPVVNRPISGRELELD